jgi:hypothetical protein
MKKGIAVRTRTATESKKVQKRCADSGINFNTPRNIAIFEGAAILIGLLIGICFIMWLVPQHNEQVKDKNESNISFSPNQ